MVTKKRVCDICGQEIKWHEKFFRFKVKSSSFINYANFDDWKPDVRKFDLCTNCINEIAKRVNEKEDEE